MNLNVHGDSYATDSVWLNRTTEKTGKSQNESSFASMDKGSVKERWMDWEREREHLREMDKDRIRETDADDTNRLRRSIVTVMSEPEPDVDIIPLILLIQTRIRRPAKRKILLKEKGEPGNRIVQTFLAAEPVTAISPPVRPGRFRTLSILRMSTDFSSRTRD